MISRNSASQAGFTLIEMIVVIALLGLMLALIGTRQSGGNATLTIEGAATELAGALRDARSEAIVANQPVSLLLDLRARAYRIDSQAPVALPDTLQVSLLTTTGEVTRNDVGGIRFDPDGSSTGGRIDLSNGREAARIAVDWLSGQVSVVYAR
jgi:general secretion pathway protein H